MLFAYALSGEGLLTAEAIQELRSVAEDLARENLPAGDQLGFFWEGLQPGTVADGTFLRGYQHIADREEALWVVQTLRRLSERFPQYGIYLSGWGDLPMTQLRAGRFELFADTYDTALALLAHHHSASLRPKTRSRS